MKLDPRICNIHDILTPFDEVTVIPGTYCVFANDIEQYENIDDCTFGHYNAFKESLDPTPFVYERTVDHETCSAKFCLPYNKIKNYYNFTLETFQELFGVNDVVTFRNKETKEEASVVYLGYYKDKDNNVRVLLGNKEYTFEELFKNYELFMDKRWELFGELTSVQY